MLSPSPFSPTYFRDWVAHMGLSPSAACSALGITSSTLNRYLAGRRPEPDPHLVRPKGTMLKLMHALERERHLKAFHDTILIAATDETTDDRWELGDFVKSLLDTDLSACQLEARLAEWQANNSTPAADSDP